MTAAEIQIWRREMAVPGTTILKSGWPDFLLSRDGATWAVEVKRPADKVSSAQLLMHAALRQAGLRVEVEVVPGIGGYNRAATQEIADTETTGQLFAHMRRLEQQLEAVREECRRRFVKPNAQVAEGAQ